VNHLAFRLGLPRYSLISTEVQKLGVVTRDNMIPLQSQLTTKKEVSEKGLAVYTIQINGGEGLEE